MTFDLSIIIPAYNEEENITELLNQIEKALINESVKYEVILVNDGSKDKTWKNFEDFARNKPNFIGIDFFGNFGQSSAMAAGIDYAKGEYIVTIDADLQNDPADIPAMLKKIKEEDWDVVTGIRSNRQDGFFLRKVPSKIGNFLIRSLTGVKLKDYGCTLKIFRSEIAKDLGLYGELHRFIPILAQLQGARMTAMNVNHHPRIYGKSKYGINRTFKVISDLILMLFFKKYLQRPMHLFGTLGIFVLFLGIAIDIYMFILKILGHDIWGKPLLILGLMFTIGGIQLITIGIMTELQMRTYYESQQKKPYKIRRTLNK